MTGWSSDANIQARLVSDFLSFSVQQTILEKAINSKHKERIDKLYKGVVAITKHQWNDESRTTPSPEPLPLPHQWPLIINKIQFPKGPRKKASLVLMFMIRAAAGYHLIIFTIIIILFLISHLHVVIIMIKVMIFTKRCIRLPCAASSVIGWTQTVFGKKAFEPAPTGRILSMLVRSFSSTSYVKSNEGTQLNDR